MALIKSHDAGVKLPPEVVERLAQSGQPKTATDIRRQEGEEMPLTTRGCLALADRMRAERMVYEEAAKLDAARGEATTAADLKATNAGLNTELRDAQQVIAELRAELGQALAKGSMAVAGDGS